MTGARAGFVNALRRLAGRKRLMPITATLLRARTVRPAPAFALRVAVRDRGTSFYRLRESGLWIAVRHGTGDEVTLGEVFHEHDYQPSGEVAASLEPVRKIVDLGANIGLFGAFAAARWPSAEIVAYEPDPANADVHALMIARNHLQSRWTLVRAAAGVEDGTARFLAGDIALSRLASEEDEAAIDVQVRDVIPELQQADLVKMDIEGGEWAILRDPRFRDSPPRAMVFEYHPSFCESPDPRAAAESALADAGLRVQSIWHREDGHGMLWAWKS